MRHATARRLNPAPYGARLTLPRKPMLLRYVRFWLSLAKFSLLGELAFRANFLIKVVVELLWLGILLVFNYTIFQQTTKIADWDANQYLFFIGCYFALGGVIEMFFLDNCNQFADLIRSGDLDFFLLKPIDEQFLISCKHIDWSCGPNILLGIAVMGYALWASDWAFAPVQLLSFVILFISGVTLAYGFLVLLMSASVWLMRNQSLFEMWWLFTTLMRYPRNLQRDLGVAGGFVLFVRGADHAGDERASARDGEMAGAVVARLVRDRLGRGDPMAEPACLSRGASALPEREQLIRLEYHPEAQARNGASPINSQALSSI